MMLTVMISAMISAMISSTGCVAEDPSQGALPATALPDEPSPAAAEPETPPEEVAVPPVAAACAPSELAFFGGPMGWTGGEHELHISPNGAVAARWSRHGWQDRVFMKLTTGEVLAEMPHNWPGAMDAGWHIRARTSDANGTGETTILVETTLTGLPMTEVSAGPPPGPVGEPWQHVAVPQISADALTLVSVDCWSRGYAETFEQHGTLSVWALPSGELTRKVQLDVGCSQWPFEPRLVLDETTSKAVVAGDGTALHAVDLLTGEVETAHFAPATLGGVNTPYPRPIVNVALSTDGARIAVVDDSETLHILDFATLDATAPTAPASIFAIDHDSYMPSFGTPLAFAPDGGHVVVGAMHDDTPALVRIDVTTGQAGPALVLPVEAQGDQPGWGINAPVSVTYLGDGSGVVVSYDVGIALWRCPQAVWPDAESSMAVVLDAPPVAKAGTSITLIATHLGPDSVHSHQFFVDGQPLAPASLTRTAIWEPQEPGDYTIEVLLDDGLTQGATDTTVTIQ
ncbi:MAG: hypothetical protein ACI9WU_000139 [Myxococcota bacterium]|jgi:hypothetical protein